MAGVSQQFAVPFAQSVKPLFRRITCVSVAMTLEELEMTSVSQRPYELRIRQGEIGR